MSYKQAHMVIRKNLDEWWEIHYPQISLLWDNEGGEPPGTPEPWAVATILPGATSLVGLAGSSSRLWRIVGVLVIQVFTPTGEGVRTAEDLHAALAEQFQGRTVEGVLLRALSMQNLGAASASAWHQHNISAGWQYDYHG